MKKLLKNIFYSQSFKKAMVNMMFSNPRLTTTDYLELRKAIQHMEKAEIRGKENQIELKKAA